MENKNIYPNLVINNNQAPNRLLAFPLLGFIIKLILLIPVFIVVFFYSIAFVFYYYSVPFVILFSGKYWDSAFNYMVGYFKFSTKISLYIYGLTDKYPGFDLSDNGLFTLNIEKPVAPSKLLAFPVLGFLIRIILLIPYAIFYTVLNSGAGFAALISWFAVLFKGRYPESLYEFERDSIRVGLAHQMYMVYLTDQYPSFYMAIKNKTVKILLIIAGILSLINQVSGFPASRDTGTTYENRDFNNTNK